MPQPAQPSPGGSVCAASGRPTRGHRSERKLSMSPPVPPSESASRRPGRRSSSACAACPGPAYFGPPAVFLTARGRFSCSSAPAGRAADHLRPGLPCRGSGSRSARRASGIAVLPGAPPAHPAPRLAVRFLRRPAGVSRMLGDHSPQPQADGRHTTGTPGPHNREERHEIVVIGGTGPSDQSWSTSSASTDTRRSLRHRSQV